MADTITGIIEAVAGPNKGGFYALKVDGNFYNLPGRNETPSVAKGQNVTFGFYLKDGKYKTIKGPVTLVPSAWAAPVNGTGNAVANGGRDSYWANREAEAVSRDARISYFAAYERALGLVTLAIANGAFPSLEKAKPAAKLDVLKAFVEATAEEIIDAASGKPPAEKIEQTAPAAAKGEEESEGWAE